MITQQWQADIVIRDLNDLRCLISAIANLLYPNLIYAQEREQKLLKILEMARLAEIVQTKITLLNMEYQAWKNQTSPPNKS